MTAVICFPSNGDIANLNVGQCYKLTLLNLLLVWSRSFDLLRGKDVTSKEGNQVIQEGEDECTRRNN